MISDYGFGRICIDGTWYTRDVKIRGTTVIADWWRGQGHICMFEDIADLLADEPEIIILGTGRPGLMKADSGLRSVLAERGIRLIEQPTAEAVQTFNNLHMVHRIGAGFHLTC
jgi:hypothetical protein